MIMECAVVPAHSKKFRPDELLRPAVLNFTHLPYAFQIMSATVLPAGMKGITCVE